MPFGAEEAQAARVEKLETTAETSASVAIILMQYPHGFGVAAVYWTQTFPDAEGANPIAYGTGGSLSTASGKVVRQRPGRAAEIITLFVPVAPFNHGPEYLLHCLETKSYVSGFYSPQIGRGAP